MRLLEEGHPQAALECAEELVSSDLEADRLSGYLSRGWIYEDGGPGLDVDLNRAFNNFLQVTLIAPDSVSYANLARVSMKMGGERGFADGFKYLNLAADRECTPEVLLGYATYYREKPSPDLQKARDFYLRAALRGRFAGFFGFSRVSRELHQHVVALGADAVRIVLAPLLAVLIGSRTRNTF